MAKAGAKRNSPRKPKVTVHRCTCCFYKAVTGKPWPEGWGVMQVMGLTDPEGKTIYMADGLSPEDNQTTLLHEFVHMEGLQSHDEKFDARYNELEMAMRKKQVVWDAQSE